ncbi:MAG: hypothetical protein J5794_05200 [Lachnospiraceae bacterium]|nr:hypothetical protein [Lachnospiraceae bacterium]
MYEEFRSVFREAVKRYPAMKPRDAAKLLYQSEFGPAHFTGTAEESLEALEEEFSATEYEEEQPLYESIGGGFTRVNLAALEPAEYPLTRLNEDFVASAAVKTGSKEHLKEKILWVTEHFQELGFLFSTEDWQLFTEKWELAGFRPISHSDEYRQLYHPAYRVIRSEYRHDFTAEKAGRETPVNRVLLRVVIGLLLVLLCVGMAFLGRFLYRLLAF